MTANTMGIDQFGNTYHGLGQHPRKALLAKLGRSKASRMFRDKANGPPVHVGYVIGPYWITLYRVEPIERPVTGMGADGRFEQPAQVVTQ